MIPAQEKKNMRWMWKPQSSWNYSLYFVTDVTVVLISLFWGHLFFSSPLHTSYNALFPYSRTKQYSIWGDHDQITPHLERSGDCMETRLKTKQNKPLICWLLFIRQWFACHCMSWAAIQKCSMTPYSINPSVGWGTIHKDLFITRLPRFHLDLALACALVSKFLAVFRVFA